MRLNWDIFDWDNALFVFACLCVIGWLLAEELNWQCVEYSYEQQQCIKKELKQPKGEL